MKRLVTSLAILGLLLPTLAKAPDYPGGPVTVWGLYDVETDDIPDCLSSRDGWEVIVTDITDKTGNCTGNGGGSNKLHCYCNGTTWIVIGDGSAAVGADSVGTTELNDGTDTPGVGECVAVDSGDTSKFEYIACGTPGANSIGETELDTTGDTCLVSEFVRISAGDADIFQCDTVAAIGAVLEADMVLSNLQGSVTDGQVPDTIALTNITQISTRPAESLTSSCTDAQVLGGTAGTGVECQADVDTTCTTAACAVGVDDSVQFYGAATPSPTDAGLCEWDTDDYRLVCGDGAASNVTFYSGDHTSDTFLSEEDVEDYVGTMVTGGTETLISVTYTDGGVGAGVLNFVVDEASIDHDALTNYDSNEHFLQSAIATVGTVTVGTWTADVIADAYIADILTLALESATLTDLGDDEVLIGQSAATGVYVSIPDCQDGSGHINYTASTNTITCGTADDDIPEAADFTNLTAAQGIAHSPTGTIAIDLLTTSDTTGVAFSYSGMEFGGTGSDELALLLGCADLDGLMWDNTQERWECTAFLLLSGGTLTGEVTVDTLGLEFEESDTHSDCSAFSSTGGGIFYHDTDNEFKKCQNNVLTALDTGGAGGNWEDLTNTADTATAYTSDNNAETVTFTFNSNFLGDRVTIQQTSGNPTAGALLQISAADTDVTLLSMASGAIQVKQDGRIEVAAVDIDYETPTSHGWPRLADDPTTGGTATDCDAANERGRLVYDAETDSGTALICTTAGWKDIDDDAGGTPAWEALANTADSATVYTADNVAETVTFNFDHTFTTGSQFSIVQDAGTPSGGTLFEVKAVDADVKVATIWDGTDGVEVTAAGILQAVGSGGVYATQMEGTDFGTMTDANFCTYDSAGTEVDCATAGALDDDDLSDDNPTALQNVSTINDGDYCQGNASSGFECDVTTIPDGDIATDLTVTAGTISDSAIVLDIEAADQTADGDIDYDTVEEVIEVGDDGTGTHKFFPVGTFTANNFCTADASLNQIDCATSGALDDDDLSDDNPTALQNVSTINDGDYCQGNASSGFECDVTTIPNADIATDLTVTAGAISDSSIVLDIEAADQTVDGDIDYDTVEEVIEVGDDGTGTHKFYPVGTFTANNFCTADASLNEVDCATSGSLDDDDLSDDNPTALQNVSTINDGDYCQGNASSGFECDVTTIPDADLPSELAYEDEANTFASAGSQEFQDPIVLTNEEVRLADAEGDYIGFGTTSRSANYSVTWALTDDCSGLGNNGKLTINASEQIVCAADIGGGGANWEDLSNTGDSATVFTADNVAETVTFNFDYTFTTGSQFKIVQDAGTPSGGTLFEVQATDPDVTVATIWDGTDGVEVTAAGVLQAVGSGAVYADQMEGTDWGTLENGEFCIYDSAGTEVDCNIEYTGTGDVVRESVATIVTPKIKATTDAPNVTVATVEGPNRGTPAINDNMKIIFNLDTSDGGLQEVGALYIQINDVTSATRDGEFLFKPRVAGSEQLTLAMGGGVLSGIETGVHIRGDQIRMDTTGTQDKPLLVLRDIGAALTEPFISLRTSGDAVIMEIQADGDIDLNDSGIITDTGPITYLELDRLAGLAGTIVTDATGVTDIEGTGLTISGSTLNCDDAVEGTGKGCAEFNANDFAVTTGTVQIDYTNGTAAATGVKGFLTGTDWDTFDGKMDDFSIDADGGAGKPGTVGDGDTLDIAGGSGIVTNWTDFPDTVTIAVDFNATLDGDGSSSNLSGLEETATGELALLQGCADGDRLIWEDTGGTWDCDALGFTLAGDGGTPQTISDGNTLTIAGGTGITTSAGATDTLTATCDTSSTTVVGCIEIATGAETNTGTDATRAVSPDALDDWTGSAQITTLGTIATGVWNGTAIDIGSYTNLGNGRSTTVNGDVVDADVELYTDAKCAYIEDPTTEDLDGITHFMNAITVTRVWCETDTGTADVNIENDDGTPANILSAELVCDTGEQTSCASGCDVNTIQGAEDNVAQYDEINFSISATSGTPNKVSICVGYTKDD